MKLYLCGPMTGYKDLNREQFEAGARFLRSAKHDVVSPAEPPILQQPQTDWEGAMRGALRGLLECEGVAVLPGWQQSRGARLEVELAKQLGMRVLPWQEWLVPTQSNGGKP